MKLTTYCLCILGAVGGMWLADQGAWASAGAIWVIAILLAIDGAVRAITKELTRPNITNNSYTSSDGRIPESEGPARPFYKPGYMPPPPPPKKAANPFKIGDHVYVRGFTDGRVSGIAGLSVKIDRLGQWFPSSDCEKVSEVKSPGHEPKQPFKVGDRVRDKNCGISGYIDAAWPDGRVIVVFDQIPDSRGVHTPVWYLAKNLELICEKQS